MRFNIPFKMVVAVSVFLTPVVTWSDVLPGPAQPEQVSRALTPSPIEPAAPLPPVQAKQEQAPIPGGEQAKKIKFQLNKIILEGNHVYTTAQIEQVYKDKLHKTITVAELFEIVQ